MILESFFNVLHPLTLLLLTLGVAWGIILGALPGFGATLGMAILIPFTYGTDPLLALPILAGIYSGAIYGGGITSIMLGVPGTSAAAATVLDGWAMTQRGESNRALTASVFASAFGGFVGGVFLLLFAPLLARVTLMFGPAEYFVLSVFGLTIIATLVGDSVLRGLISGFFGLVLAMVGLDPITGQERLTFGNVYLLDGIPLIPAILAMFAFPRCLQFVRDVFDGKHSVERSTSQFVGPRMKLAEIASLWRTMIRSSFLGTLIGVIPGAGANIACWIGYSEAKRKSKNPERFGTGIPEGVVAAEAANNATEGGSLVPMLTLGIPGSSASAVIFGALMIHGLEPGANLFTKHAEITYTFIWAIIISNIVMLVLGYFGSSFFARLSQVPLVILVPTMLLVTLLGAFAGRQLVFDVGLTVALGSLFYLFTLLRLPIPPVLLGFILGPIAEKGLRRAMLISGGDVTIFFTRPICLLLIVFIVLSLFAGFRMIRAQHSKDL